MVGAMKHQGANGVNGQRMPSCASLYGRRNGGEAAAGQVGLLEWPREQEPLVNGGTVALEEAVRHYLAGRVPHLHRHLDHLRALRPRVTSTAVFEGNLSLRNDVLFSLLIMCQLVIDIASELATHRQAPFEDETEAIRALAVYPEFPTAVLADLERLPGFRNVLVHEYVTLNLDRAIEALDRLEPVERFLEIVRDLESRA